MQYAYSLQFVNSQVQYAYSLQFVSSTGAVHLHFTISKQYKCSKLTLYDL